MIPVIMLLCVGCARPPVTDKMASRQAPDVFQVMFITTHGDFEIEAVRKWSPAGVDRLYQLVRSGFYEDIAIFRVVPGFVAQFGISGDSTLNSAWSSFKVPDEPVVQGNEKGTLSFARGGPQTRTTQLFINLEDNPRLDTLNYLGVTGFPVIARVTDGMDVVLSFFEEYGGEPANKQDSIYTYGNAYLHRNYPELDYIESAHIIP